MFDWLWHLAAGALGVAAVWFGFRSAHLKRRAEQDKHDRIQAQNDLIERSIKQLEATRARYADMQPVDPKKRTDLE